MPTQRRRHAVTETAPVARVLDELRAETGTDRVELAELVILGARERLRQLRQERDEQVGLRRRLADRVRAGDVGVDVWAADEVRRHGWARE
jgi:hypothetical protein